MSGRTRVQGLRDMTDEEKEEVYRALKVIPRVSVSWRLFTAGASFYSEPPEDNAVAEPEIEDDSDVESSDDESAAKAGNAAGDVDAAAGVGAGAGAGVAAPAAAPVNPDLPRFKEFDHVTLEVTLRHDNLNDGEVRVCACMSLLR